MQLTRTEEVNNQKSTSSECTDQNILLDLQVINQLRQQQNLSLAAQKAKSALDKTAFSIEIMSVLIDILIDQRSAQSALDLIEIYQNEIDQQPKCKELMAAQSKALLAVGQRNTALQLIDNTTQSFPEWADGWNNHGCTLVNLGRPTEAINKFEKALTLAPNHTKAALALSAIFKKLKCNTKAIETLQNCFNQSNDIDLLEATVNLLQLENRHKEALILAKKIIELSDSASIEHQMLLARCYFLNGELDAYILTLQRCPQHQLWKGVSIRSITEGVIAESGLQKELGSDLDSLLRDEPADANANLILAREKLRHFDFVNGWKHYAHRLKLPNPQLHFNELPSWDGSHLKDEHVLVIGEQGLGDVGYFSRFLTPLHLSNRSVSMLCEARMTCFLQHSFPDIYFFSNPKEIKLLPKSTSRIALGSLPLLYGNDLESIQQLGKKFPIRVRHSDRQIWKERLRYDSQGLPVIGISLQGGRNGDEYQQRKRSLPIEKTLSLFRGKKVALLDMQHPRHSDKFLEIAKKFDLKILHYPHLTDDINQLIAVLSCLDGLISAQQTNAHLAGSLGLKGIIVLPVVSHFVYGLEDTSPWYPTLNLVRASKFGEWESSIESMRIAISQWPI